MRQPGNPKARGIAAHCIAAELASLLNVDKVQAPIHKSAVEYNPACQAELLQQQTCKPSCLFGDCQSFWIPRVRDTLEKLKKENAPLNRVTMMPLVKSGKACTRRAWCEVHKKHCDIQPARDLWAGFPCVSWSPQGQRERDNGQDFLSFCAFAALTLELEDGAVVGVVTRGGEVGEVGGGIAGSQFIISPCLDPSPVLRRHEMHSRIVIRMS